MSASSLRESGGIERYLVTQRARKEARVACLARADQAHARAQQRRQILLESEPLVGDRGRCESRNSTKTSKLLEPD
jgi:hypothetical protein